MTQALTYKLDPAEWAAIVQEDATEPVQVRETTTTTGAGPLTLAGAEAGFQAASAVYAVGDVFNGAVTDGEDWEYGQYTYTSGNAVARSRIEGSTDGGDAINWGAGTKTFIANVPDAQTALRFLLLELAAEALKPGDIGTTVQAWDTDLDWLSGNLSTKGRELAAAADAAAVRTAAGAVIGTNVQAWSANLDEYAGVNPSAAGLSLLDDADAAAQRVTLGLGNVENTALSTWAGSANLITLGAAVATSLQTPTINGGTAANDDITIQGTSHATRTTSYVNLQPNGGNVGIGTATPVFSLHIQKDQNALTFGGLINTSTGLSAGTGFFLARDTGLAEGAYGEFFWMNANANSANLFAIPNSMNLDGSGTGGVGIYAHHASGVIRFGTGGYATGNERMRITSAGLVGIGTTAPDKVLELNLGTASAFRLTYNDANGSAATYMDTTLSSTGVTTFTGAGSAPAFSFAQGVIVGGPLRKKAYTVATLPAGVQGDTAFVTDAAAPAFLTAVAGGGAVVTPVFYNGAAWVAA